jgi:hypothetical protein
MELHRVIFRVDFPPAFELFNRWGDALALLNRNKLWTNLGETPNIRQIVAQHTDQDKGVNHNTIVAVNNINGNLEEYPIRSLDSFGQVFAAVSELVDLMKVSSFLRVGARFVFLEEAESFEVVRDNFAGQMRAEYVGLFKGELTDLSLITVHKDGDNFSRMNAGPIAKKEYAGWFSIPNMVRIENGLIADVDFYTLNYKFKTFNLGKFIELAFTVARKQSGELIRMIKREGN